MNEFEMIQKYFVPLTMGRKEAYALSDDAAVLNIPEGYDLVVSSDSLNAGVHFLKGEDPAMIAHKTLRVNLSDMAAMGAKPYAYQLNIAFSNHPDEGWVKKFCKALLEDNRFFDVFCSGGDTTVTEGPMMISMTMIGLVPAGRAVHRRGAKPGDLVVLTGAIGAAIIGVKVTLDAIKVCKPAPFLKAMHQPQPRVALSDAIREYAHAAIDISDGLLADIGHICSASGVAARIKLADVPFSAETQAVIDQGIVSYEDVLTGGEDYEIVMAIAPDQYDALAAQAVAQNVPLTVIGSFEGGKGVQVLDRAGKVLKFTRRGWTHF